MALGNGSASNGIKLVKEYWKKIGLNTEELYLVDGSGLSRENTLTTNFQANLLVKIYFDKNYPVLLKSLPAAGKEGSMSQIGNETFIENNMQAKTGYINRVRAYCGFLKSKSGKNLAFSLIINNYNCSAKSAKNKLEKFLIELGNL
jgi:D-alanyl-D-alanine carboxypeptidase/D-alanyl-D-alanine-endopeptidase (penicillin-binding protein 4)